MQIEDSQIIGRCLGGDKAAFGLLVDKYKASIYALVYSKIGDFRESEDITQKIFVQAFRNLSKLNQNDNFAEWLYTIAKDITINKEESQ